MTKQLPQEIQAIVEDLSEIILKPFVSKYPDLGKEKEFLSEMIITALHPYLSLPKQEETRPLTEIESKIIKKLAFPELCDSVDEQKICDACYGKWKYSVYKWDAVAWVDFPWDKPFVVEQWWVKEFPCPKCKGKQ